MKKGKSERFAFTQESVRAFSCVPETGKRIYAYDTSEKGLVLSVTPAGTKTFFYRGRINGQPDRVPLGRFPETSAAKAKSRVILVRAAIEEGRDPREAVTISLRRRPNIPTLLEFWEIYVEDYAKLNRIHWKTSDREFKFHVGNLGHMPLDTITSERLRRWYNEKGRQSGWHLANKMINLLRAVYNKATLWHGPNGKAYASINPAASNRVERVFTNIDRDRFLQASEMPKFFEVLADFEPAGARHYFQMVLFTAARRGQVKAMAWQDIDLANRIWTIPSSSIKGNVGKRRPHVVPLIDRAVRILELRRELIRGTWVFPGKNNNGSHIQNVNSWWGQIRTRAGTPDLTIHDLRRTTASWMTITHASWPIVADLLGHRGHGATQIYARLAVDPVRDAVDVAMDRIFKEAGVE